MRPQWGDAPSEKDPRGRIMSLGPQVSYFSFCFFILTMFLDTITTHNHPAHLQWKKGVVFRNLSRCRTSWAPVSIIWVFSFGSLLTCNYISDYAYSCCRNHYLSATIKGTREFEMHPHFMTWRWDDVVDSTVQCTNQFTKFAASLTGHYLFLFFFCTENELYCLCLKYMSMYSYLAMNL